MKRVLLTGASGFVGRHCLPALLARGYEVHATSSKAEVSGAPLSEAYWHQVDLLSAAQVSCLLEELRPTYLLHCAWYAVPGKYWSSPENFRWLDASLHLFKTFAATGGQRVVGVGTCAEYDWGDGHCSEATTPLNPTTTYGVCKHAFQLLLTSFCKQAELSAAWGRLFFLYGPHESEERLVASAIRSILAGEPARCSHGRQMRDFLYVVEAADALVALLDSNVSGPMNIASGVPVAVSEVVREIAAQLGRPDLVQLGAIPASDSDPPLLVGDITRLRDELGWTPRYDLPRGLAATIDSWKLQQSGAET